MWLNLVALAVLGVFVALGAWRGALASGLSIATLLLSYAAALFLGPAFAPTLDASLQVGPLLAVPLAGAAAFVASYLLLGLVVGMVRRAAHAADDARGPLDRLLGGTFGAMRGLLIAFLLVYLAMWLDALRATGSDAWIPEVGYSAAAELTSQLVEGAVGAAMDPDDPAARVTARVAARPVLAAVELQSVIDDPGFESLRSDRVFWSHVESGQVDAATNRSSFRRIEQDAQLRHQLANLALVPDEAAEDPEAFRLAVAEVLREVGPRIRGLRNDPALQELLRDPQVIAMIQRGDTLGLLGHPGFREVVGRVTSATSQD